MPILNTSSYSLNLTGSDSAFPSPYTIEVSEEGKLQFYEDGVLIYEQDEDGLWIRTSVTTGTGSFHLGDLLSIGSGGDQITFINEDTQYAHYPSWGYLSTDGTAYVPTKDRVHGDLQTVELNGDATTTPVDYNFTFTASENAAFFRIDLVAGETYSGDLVWKSLKSSGLELATFTKTVDISSGDSVDFSFEYPLWVVDGEELTLTITKDDGTYLSVMAGETDETEPYRLAYYREFVDYTSLNTGNRDDLVDTLNGGTGDVSFSVLKDLPIATAATLGLIKVDASSIVVDANGVISAASKSARYVVVASETAMLALETVDDLTIAQRTDTETLWYLNAEEDPSSLSNWTEGGSTAAAVASFNSRVGVVMPVTGDYLAYIPTYSSTEDYDTGVCVVDSTGIPYVSNGAIASGTTFAIGTTGATWRYLVPVATSTSDGMLSAEDKAIIDALAETYVPLTRSISTTSPLNGGGSLSSNLSLTVDNATTDSPGVIQLAGDLSGTYEEPLVSSLQSYTVSSTQPTSGYPLVWDGTDYQTRQLDVDSIDGLSDRLSVIEGQGGIYYGMTAGFIRGNTDDFNGWVFMDGRAITELSTDQQAVCATLGITTSLPDATDKLIGGAGGSRWEVGGSYGTFTLTRANLPNVTLTPTVTYSPSGTVTITDPGHDHDMDSGGSHNHKQTTYSGSGIGSSSSDDMVWYNSDAKSTSTRTLSSSGSSHTHDINSNTTGITATFTGGTNLVATVSAIYMNGSVTQTEHIPSLIAEYHYIYLGL